MHDSLQCVRDLVAGRRPGRIPLFDLVANDAILQHFNGSQPVLCGDDRTAVQALTAALDATRTTAFSPTAPRIEQLPDGRELRHERWTTWVGHIPPMASDDYARLKRRELAEIRRQMDAAPPDLTRDAPYRRQREIHSWFGDGGYYVLSGRNPKLSSVFGVVGLEQFAYYLADCEEVVIEQLELNTESACRWYRALPEDDPFEMIFLGDDLAYKTGLLVNPQWLRREYFPRLRRVVAAIHARGKKVMFHSDGDLNAIMDDLVEAGIDVLNPIEVMAGMNVAQLHRRYPPLIFAGAIDVSQLLPFADTQTIRETVVRTIEDAEGRILIGSSTEVSASVPLENFLAMREAVMGFKV